MGKVSSSLLVPRLGSHFEKEGRNLYVSYVRDIRTYYRFLKTEPEIYN